MKYLNLLLLVLLFTSCYQPPKIDGFDTDQWSAALTECTDYRIVTIEHLVKEQEEKILSLNQNEVSNLFGNPSQHQLYNRNQKFFYYQLDCENTKRLALRFDALGRVKEIQVEKVNK